MQVDRRLVWDYDLSQVDPEDEGFQRWYLARVLTRGGLADLQAIGFKTIREKLPSLVLPEKIRRFWEAYFALPA